MIITLCSGFREYTSLVPSRRPMANRRPFGDQATTVTGDCPGDGVQHLVVCHPLHSDRPFGVSDQQRGPVGGDGHVRQAIARAGEGCGSDELRAPQVDDHPGGLPDRRGGHPGEHDRCTVSCCAECRPDQYGPRGVVTGQPRDGHGLRADPALTASMPDAHLPLEHRDEGASVGRDAKPVRGVVVVVPVMALRARHLLPRACRVTTAHVDRVQPDRGLDPRRAGGR